jgi:hypothetical protein
MKNVTPTYPLSARGYDLPSRPEPKWKAVFSRATPTTVEVLTGRILLVAYAGTLVTRVLLGNDQCSFRVSEEEKRPFRNRPDSWLWSGLVRRAYIPKRF